MIASKLSYRLHTKVALGWLEERRCSPSSALSPLYPNGSPPKLQHASCTSTMLYSCKPGQLHTVGATYQYLHNCSKAQSRATHVEDPTAPDPQHHCPRDVNFCYTTRRRLLYAIVSLAPSCTLQCPRLRTLPRAPPRALPRRLPRALPLTSLCKLPSHDGLHRESAPSPAAYC